MAKKNPKKPRGGNAANTSKSIDWTALWTRFVAFVRGLWPRRPEVPVAPEQNPLPEQQEVPPPQPGPAEPIPLQADPPPQIVPEPPPPAPEPTVEDLEKSKLKLEIEVLEEELAELRRGNAPESFYRPTKIWDLFAPICALIATLTAAVLTTLALMNNGVLNATSILNRAEATKIQNDITDLTKQKAEAEAVLFPARDEMKAIEKLTALSANGLSIEISQFLHSKAKRVSIGGGKAIADQDISEEVFANIGKLQKVESVDVSRFTINDAVWSVLKKCDHVTIQDCKLNVSRSDWGPKLRGAYFSKCSGTIALTGNTDQLRDFTISESPGAQELLKGAAVKMPGLMQLKLAGPSVGDDLIDDLKVHPSLFFLILNDAKITSKAVDSALAIPTLAGLTVDPNVATDEQLRDKRVSVSRHVDQSTLLRMMNLAIPLNLKPSK